MANSEDYLDGLLESISQAKSDSSLSALQKKRQQEQKIANRNRVGANDDFMSANGLNDYKPRRVERTNLRAALSERDLLKEFEDELEFGDADSFISDFEKEIDAEERAYAEGIETPTDPMVEELLREEAAENADNSNDEAEEVVADSTDTYEAEENSDSDAYEDESDGLELSIEPDDIESEDVESDFSDSEENDSVDNDEDDDEEEDFSVDDILSGAMKEMEGNASAEDNDFLQPEFTPDELDAEDAIRSQESEAENDGLSLETDGLDLDNDGLSLDSGDDFDAEPLMDENDESLDLMDMLEGDESGDLSDIGDLLNSDENGDELDEARDEFEHAAENVDNPAESDVDAKEEKKKGSLIDKIKAFFAGMLEDDEDEVVEIHDNQKPEDTTAENADILKEFENGEGELSPKEAKAAAKEAKKKEKEEAKKVKDAEKEEAKKAKEAEKQAKAKAKKEAADAKKAAKKPDNSPRVPLKLVIAGLILAISIAALVLVFINLVGYSKSINAAKSSYENGNYIQAYNDINGISLKEDDQTLYQQILLLATVQQKYKSYEEFMADAQYDLALDQLIIAYGTYLDHASEADGLGILDMYNAEGDYVLNALSSQFNVSAESATELYKMDDRTEYTLAIQRILASLGITIE